MDRSSWAVPFALVLLLAGACERAPLDIDCQPLASGELAITEVRGPQAGTDTWGQWIELASTTTAELALGGVTINLRKLDGSGERNLVVRDRELTLTPGDYFVLGRFPAGAEPAHIDWGYEEDFSGDLYADAVVEVHSCGQLVDRLVWRGLPNQGSWSYDGNLPPDALGNDDDAAWCNDQDPGPPADGGTTAGLPGTPGEANRPCP